MGPLSAHAFLHSRDAFWCRCTLFRPSNNLFCFLTKSVPADRVAARGGSESRPRCALMSCRLLLQAGEMEPQSLQTLKALSPWQPGLLSLLLYAAIILILVALLLVLTGWLGVKNRTAEKRRPYESGVIPTGMAHLRYPVPFFLVATFFLIFDVEVAYLFSWAVAFDPLGWLGWLQISFFILVLLVSLCYIWVKGGLDWGATRRR